MMVLTLGLMFLPWIPGLRSIPRWCRSTGWSGATTTGHAADLPGPRRPVTGPAGNLSPTAGP